MKIDVDGVIFDYDRVLKTYGDLYDFIELKKDIKQSYKTVRLM